MKTSRLLVVTGLLTLGASFLSAGPSPQFWNRPTTPAPAAVAATTATTTSPAPAMTCAAMSDCACCKKA